MGLDSIWHWLVVLLIVVVLFGTKRLKNVGGDLGEAVRGFKKGMRGDDATDASTQPSTTQSLPPAAASDATRPAPAAVHPDDDRNPPVAR